MSKLFQRAKLESLQYGFRPNSILKSLASSNRSKILANSIPKSGTNLLSRSLYLLPDYSRKFSKTLLNSQPERTARCIQTLGPKQFCMAHLKYESTIEELIEKNNIRHVMMVRDPRDIAVSSASYITRIDPNHRLHPYFSQTLTNTKDRIEAILQGIASDKLGGQEASLGLVNHFEGYLGWAVMPQCHVVRFEDLVGEQGGGSRAKQLETLQTLYDHLQIRVVKKDIELVSDNLFSTASRTFNKGLIGAWAEEFKTHNLDATQYGLAHILGQFGYAH